MRIELEHQSRKDAEIDESNFIWKTLSDSDALSILHSTDIELCAIHKELIDGELQTIDSTIDSPEAYVKAKEECRQFAIPVCMLKIIPE